MEIFFREQGQGTPIILIHGFCETHEIWNGFFEELSDFGRVIAIDLPGFGGSPLPAVPFSIDTVAEILLDWIKKNKINDPLLIGHSLGGYVALAMAASEPQYCKRLTLFHSSIYADTEEKKANRDKVIDFVIRNGIEPFIETFVPSLFYNKHHPDIERVKSICAKTPEKTLLEYTKAMRDRPSREDFFNAYSGKCLVIAGDMDEIIPLEVSKKMALTASKSIFLSLPATGHMGMIESRSLAITGIRENFCD